MTPFPHNPDPAPYHSEPNPGRFKKSPHTPTPWKYTTNVGPTQALLTEDDGSTIAMLRNVAGQSAFEANARFIVTACNAHDGLVSAQEQLIADNVMLRHYLRRIECGDFEGAGHAKQIARSALAKVKT
jgi:hypothetical protein